MELNSAGQILVESVDFAYEKDKIVLKGFDCQINAGEKVAILGHNGAGKTTLFSLIAGLLPGYSGKMTIDGEEVCGLTRGRLARKVALVPQKHEPLFPYLAKDFIMMGRYSSLGIFGNPTSEDRERVQLAAQETGADRFLDRPYNALSGGEMQLVLIARALVQEAGVLILDEPSTHLDFKNRFVVMDLVRKISERRKMTLLMSLHEPNDVLQFADRVIVMCDGRKAADGKPADVVNEKMLAEFFGVRAEKIGSGDNCLFRPVGII